MDLNRRIVIFFLLAFSFFSLAICNAAESGRGDINVKKERLYEDVRFLTSIHPARNYKNVASLNKAADYIISEFNKTGCHVSIQTFKGDNNEYKNIVCSFGPETGQRVVIGAHYDVRGETPGADDNASGVAGLIELGRVLSEMKPDLGHPVDLVAFTLEERRPFGPRHMGSSVYAHALKKAKTQVKAMLSLEMIGYYSDRHGSQAYPLPGLKAFYPDTGNYIAVVGRWGGCNRVKTVKALISKGSRISVQSICTSSYVPGIDFSDHASFWHVGYQAVMITDTAFCRNKNYHKKTDTIDTLNFDKMADVVKGIYWITINI